MQRNINYSETFGVSVVLSSIAISSPFTRTKILHDNELNPFAYAIGYGCNYNSSVIIGGTDEEDEISSYILIKFAQDICKACETGKTIMGIDVTKALSNKGIWIIPSYNACKEKAKAKNLIVNKIYPTKMLELTSCENGIKYNLGKNAITNKRLLTFLLSSSRGADIENSEPLPDDSLANWFSKTVSKPAFRMGIGKSDEQSMMSGADIIYRKLIEFFLLFIIS